MRGCDKFAIGVGSQVLRRLCASLSGLSYKLHLCFGIEIFEWRCPSTAIRLPEPDSLTSQH